MKLTKKSLALGALAAILLTVGGFFAFRPAEKAVTIVGAESAPITLTTRKRTVGEALELAGVKLGPKDQLQPAITDPLTKETQIEVRRAAAVSVTADGKTVNGLVIAATVGDALKELAIELGPIDRVEPPVTTAITPDLGVKIVRVREEVVTTREEIPFDVERQEDRTMNDGETRELVTGQPGEREIVTKTVFEDGVQVRTETVSTQVVTEPVNRVVAYGTIRTVSRGGRTFRYSKVMTMSATGYSAKEPGLSDYTATGMLARNGVVAVDPRVIPLYTRVYVEGYGFAIAGDTGGAIKGNKIDLCYDTVEEANAWGRRNVTVYILEP